MSKDSGGQVNSLGYGNNVHGWYNGLSASDPLLMGKVQRLDERGLIQLKI